MKREQEMGREAFREGVLAVGSNEYLILIIGGFIGTDSGFHEIERQCRATCQLLKGLVTSRFPQYVSSITLYANYNLITK